MLLQELYMTCHFVLVVVSPSLVVPDPMVPVLVGIGIAVRLCAITALVIHMVVRHIGSTPAFIQRLHLSESFRAVRRITLRCRGSSQPRAPTGTPLAA